MKQECNSSVQKAMWGYVLPNLSRYITQNCISVDQLTQNWNGGTHNRSTLYYQCGTEVFQERFLDKITGVKGGVDFMEGFTQAQRAFMCVCFLFNFATLRRNKMRKAAWRCA